MRWLFLFIVFLNLFFYVWQNQQTADAPQATSVDNLQVPTIQLAKDHPELTKPHDSAPSATVTETTPLPTKTPLTCLYLGGFTNAEQLSVINTYLKKIDANLEVETIKQKTVPQIELYIATKKSDQLVTIEQLDKLTINSLIILRGTLKGNISLGMFSDEKEYADIKDTLKDTNLSIKTQKLVQSAPSYWLQVPNDQYALFSHDKLRELVRNFPTAQQELMPCMTKAQD